MLTSAYTHLKTLTDCYGAPLAEYFYLAESSLLYIRWHGQLTAPEVIRGVVAGTELLMAHPFTRVLNDKRNAGGDWSEALPWLQYEWAPRAAAAGLRAIAYLLPPDLPAQIVSYVFVEAMKDHIAVSLFTSVDEARIWLQTQ